MSEIIDHCQRALKARNTQIPDVRFLIKTLRQTWVKTLKKISYAVLRKSIWKSGNFLKTCLFWKNCFWSYIYISTLLFIYNQMKMDNLFNLIREACNIFQTQAVPPFVGNLWATGWLFLSDIKWPPDFFVFFVS